MKKTKKMLSFVLSMLLIVTMFPTMAFAKEEAKTWKFGELSLKAGDVLGKDTEIKNDAENREIRILSEKTNPDEKTALVVVPDYQLSLAIGKEGQNARLAARLTGFKIDIKSETQARESGDFYDDYDEEHEEAEDEMTEEAVSEEIPETEEDTEETETEAEETADGDAEE